MSVLYRWKIIHGTDFPYYNCIFEILFFSTFSECFLVGRDLYICVAQTVPGNFSLVFVAQREGGGMFMDDNPFGEQTHVSFPPLYPKEP